MNNELIKITTNEEGKKLVSARELYFGLGMDTKKWSRWRETNIVNNEYFKENEDWTSFPIMVNGNETVDVEMLQVKDRKELIEKIDVKSNGKILKKINNLNGALEERGINYRIVEFSTSKMINGKQKKYPNAWKIRKLTD